MDNKTAYFNGISAELSEKIQKLLSILKSYGKIAIAFSGGVDSSVLVKAALESVGRNNCVALTALSASSPKNDKSRIENLASDWGIEIQFVQTSELELPEYKKNPPDRCYYCKRVILTQLRQAAQNTGYNVLIEGSNADDALDYRPGNRAVSELNVLSPLAEAKLTKADIRSAARFWNLSVADRPSTPCLSSRIAYGVEITPARLERIDQAESFLDSLGVEIKRVRLLAPEVACIETTDDWIVRLAEPEVRQKIARYFLQLGFSRICLNLTPFRSGSLNNTINPHS